MSKQTKQALVPKLRFPEFASTESWAETPLINLIEEFREKSTIQDAFEVITSAKNGLIRQKDYYNNNKRMADRNNIGFNIIPPNYLTYRSRSDDRRFFFNENNLGITGIISSYYPVFRLIKASNKFFVELLSFHSNIVGKHSVGTSQTVLSLNELKRIKLPLPKNDEQQKIADCLSSLDELITAQTQKLDGLKTHKKGLMQLLFPAEGENLPQLRFPEFRDAGEWEIKPLDSLLTIGNGRDYKHLSKGDIPVYGSGGYMLSVNDYLYDGESVCIGRKGTINNPMFLLGKFWTVDTLFYTHSFKDCLPKFIYFIFQNINWLNHNEAGGVPSLSKTNINKIEVAVPAPIEQQKIADCLSSIDELIVALAQKTDALKVHKKGLMQQLFPSADEVAG